MPEAAAETPLWYPPIRMHLRDLPDRWASEGIDIMFLADLHIGHEAHRPGPVAQALEWIKAKPNRYCMLLGDMMETALLDSKGDPYEQRYPPRVQAKMVADTFRPVRDRILGAVAGNHEYRVYKRTSFDPAMLYAAELDIPYEQDAMLVGIRMRSPRHMRNEKRAIPAEHVLFSGYVTHGWSAARTIGAKLNSVTLLRQEVGDCDFYAIGHVHEEIAHIAGSYFLNPITKTAGYKEQAFLVCGSAMARASYAVRAGYRTGALRFPILHLGQRSVHVRGTRNDARMVREISITT